MDAVLNLTLALSAALLAILACLAAYEKFILDLQEKDALKAAKVRRAIVTSLKVLVVAFVFFGLATGWLLVIVLI